MADMREVQEVGRLDITNKQGQWASAHLTLDVDEKGLLVLYLYVDPPSDTDASQSIDYEIQHRDSATGAWVASAYASRWRGNDALPGEIRVPLDYGQGANLRGHDVRGVLISREVAVCGLRVCVEAPAAQVREA